MQSYSVALLGHNGPNTQQHKAFRASDIEGKVLWCQLEEANIHQELVEDSPSDPPSTPSTP
ncbi:hypothetical protein E2C01_021330 [Portunus trituberculatus]|uniref:Uncharacterized protein n=1 Tax=Portunus trituberculatus TaxID=210409 RepID=A0A5B7E438_PORTR|nr:hypothetical protein [Portunus trituberculatus]